MWADLNRHVSADSEVCERMHGGHGFGTANADDEQILDLAVSFEVAITNIFFCKTNA